jgi:ribosomal protein S18 acetylase RimI-like enzyme
MELQPYHGLNDLHAMLDLLTAGRNADNGTHYVHRGDLQWWLFYTYVPQETWQANIYLWKDADRLLGWVLLSMDDNAFDVYVQPELCGTAQEEELLSWTVEKMSELNEVQTIWVAEDDAFRKGWLEQRGFLVDEKEYFCFLKRDLSGPLDGPALPAGFTLRHSRGEEDARLRSVTSAAAFESSKPFDEYLLRTSRFMQSPVYVPEHELFVEAADGTIASFCIIWTDPVTKTGLFEPVGTHPQFQRKGLGKSLLFEGFRKLKAQGMTEASLCTHNTNPAAMRLYESVGFRQVKRLLTYTRKRG